MKKGTLRPRPHHSPTYTSNIVVIVIISLFLLLGKLENVSITATTTTTSTISTTTTTGIVDWNMLASLPYISRGSSSSSSSDDDSQVQQQQEQYNNYYRHGTMRSIEEIRQMLMKSTGSSEEFEINDMMNDGNKNTVYRANVEHRHLAQDYDNLIVNGHYIRLNNPRHHFSIVQPRGGCTNGVMGDGRATVKESVSALQSQKPSDANYRVFNGKNVRCLWATNAGFFDMGNGQCFGNVVSNGHLIQSSSLANVNFATTKAGKIMVGYMGTVEEANLLLRNRTNNQEDEIDNMVGGVIWLVRNGQSFVSESYFIEHMETQKSGDNFVDLRASRIALGHDDEGRIVIVEMDGGGGGYHKGPTLHELAQLLIQLGVKNAINIDGGGSTTIVRGFNTTGDVTVLNNPTDRCKGNGMFRCERAVTTFTCIHDSLVDNGQKKNNSTIVEEPTPQFNKQFCKEEYSRLLQIVLLLAGGLAVILMVNLLFICSTFIYSRLYPIDQKRHGKTLLEDQSISDDLYLSEEDGAMGDDAMELQLGTPPSVELKQIRPM